MKIVTFGEIMMRLNPEGYQRFVQADKFEATYAGGEANVAVSLANYGLAASFVTKLPANPLGESARNEVRRFGVSTDDIVWGGPRLGIYFVEKGASQRASKVVYDRAGSSIALAKRSDFNWAKIFKGAKWFHFTGITPALGGELPAICLDALKYCKAHKITVSCDLNYRGKLWTKAEAGTCMAKLVPYVVQCSFFETTPFLEKIIISPGSTSRSNSAPTALSAQLSEATTYIPSGVLPKHNGLKP